jgi:hypothetical protein
LRSRINPTYATHIGTESYERRICVEALEAQQAEIAALQKKLDEYYDSLMYDLECYINLKYTSPTLYELEDPSFMKGFVMGTIDISKKLIQKIKQKNLL